MKPPIIALITDFGTSDPYVGIMKGILAGISPETIFIDLTHHIPPGNIQRGAFVLWQSSLDLPQGTIFLAVVDPTTFHGRDIFAPAAAYAANGIWGDKFGNAVKSIQCLPEPRLVKKGSSLSGEVISTDKFGNIFTSLGRFQSTDSWDLILGSWINHINCKIKDRTHVEIILKGKTLSLVKTFAMVPEGTCAGLIGSTGLLEIVCNQGSAAKLLSLKRGDEIILRW